MGQFKPMPKMETTEPSVILKLKKGGTVKKADGGALPIRNPGRVAGAAAPALAAQMAQARGRAALMNAPTIARPAPGMPAQAMGRKKGGMMESAAHEKKEEREIKGIKKELKAHESKPASKGHRGLKTGGVISKNEGSKTGSVEQFRGGYKKGGMAEGGTASDIESMINAKSKTPMTSSDQPNEKDLAAMRQQLADQKMDEATNRGYERTYGSPSKRTPPPSLPLSKKTGGVIKKFADGGHCTMKSGGAAGFKTNKKSCSW